jgi:hypothetical protein
MDMKRVFAITSKELRRNFFGIISFLLMSAVYVALMSQRSVFDFVEEKNFLDTSYMFILGIFMYMIVFAGIMSSEKSEDKYNGYKFLKTLPVAPKEIIWGKYLAIFIHTVIGIVYLSGINEIMYNAYEFDKLPQTYIFFAGGLALAAVGLLYIPAARFSYSRLLVPIMLVYILLMVSPQLLSFIMMASGREEALYIFVGKFLNMNFPVYLLVCTIIFCLCTIPAVKMHSLRNDN